MASMNWKNVPTRIKEAVRATPPPRHRIRKRMTRTLNPFKSDSDAPSPTLAAAWEGVIGDEGQRGWRPNLGLGMEDGRWQGADCIRAIGPFEGVGVEAHNWCWRRLGRDTKKPAGGWPAGLFGGGWSAGHVADGF